MAISEDKTRTNITIEKTLKKQLEEEAKKQNRSFNNLVITILKEYIKNKK
ncbi:hypothetical protein [Intestinibacter sp.]